MRDKITHFYFVRHQLQSGMAGRQERVARYRTCHYENIKRSEGI